MELETSHGKQPSKGIMCKEQVKKEKKSSSRHSRKTTLKIKKKKANPLYF
jgi:hypothetical protein